MLPENSTMKMHHKNTPADNELNIIAFAPISLCFIIIRMKFISKIKNHKIKKTGNMYSTRYSLDSYRLTIVIPKVNIGII